MKTVYILILSIISFACNAQDLTQTIRGVVLDKQTQSPLPGAIIAIYNTNPMVATTTDENGKFRLENVPLGRKQLKISLLSYKEKSQTVVLSSGKETVLNIEHCKQSL